MDINAVKKGEMRRRAAGHTCGSRFGIVEVAVTACLRGRSLMIWFVLTDKLYDCCEKGRKVSGDFLALSLAIFFCYTFLGCKTGHCSKTLSIVGRLSGSNASIFLTNPETSSCMSDCWPKLSSFSDASTLQARLCGPCLLKVFHLNKSGRKILTKAKPHAHTSIERS